MGDRELLQIVDAAMAEAARRSGAWLVCRPGCYSCCLGLFPISRLDAVRLQQGLTELAASDPARATRVRQRAQTAASQFAGASVPALLDSDLYDDAPCPALDPDAGTCDLYASRPITCRTFGPPVRCGSESVGVCELCFEGATDEEIAACEVEVDPDGFEFELVQRIEEMTGESGNTIVAFALVSGY
jgi:Fe-S-cluster containining protein